MIISSQVCAENTYCGGKASALARLVILGYNVPEFFVITDGENLDADELKANAKVLGSGPYAVRSSALQEDGSEHSHAGQYDSILNVTPAKLMTAVKKVYESGNAEGIKKYRKERGLDGADTQPAVIVQNMIAAQKAGVVFSADPVSGVRETIIISATDGLGDKLVAGEVDGNSWWVNKSTNKIEKHDGDIDFLTFDEINKICELAKSIEQDFKCPQDIEWAIKGDELFLLQSRPITAGLRDNAVEDEEILVFDNSNIIESYPGIVSPLTYSFASYAYARVYTAFVKLLGVDVEKVAENRVVFENMLARIDGRVYYNLGNWYRALALLPGYELNASYMETMMGVGEPLPKEIFDKISPKAVGANAFIEYLKLAKGGLGLAIEAIRLGSRSKDFYRRLDVALKATTKEKIEQLSLSGLADEYRRLETQLLDKWDAPLINDFLCMIAYGASRKLLDKWCGKVGLEIHNDVLIGQGDIISAKPAQLIKQMGEMARGDNELLLALEKNDHEFVISSKISKQVSDYIAEFGDRCTQELKLESITLDKNPITLYNAIIAAANQPRRSEAVHADGFKTMEDVFANKPVKKNIAKVALNLAKRRVRDRENLRYERTRIFGRARQLFLAMGRKMALIGAINNERDVFYLNVSEVLGAIEGNAISTDLKSIIELRRNENATFEAIKEPPERIIINGSYISNIKMHAPQKEVDNGSKVTGIGCSAGRVTAVARVIRNPLIEKIAAGEILVAQNTDPGWIALFANAAAIVVERGSLLSHSAIVSRELGIPCVVGIRGATSWIKDGETIIVDGTSGEIIRLESDLNEH